MKSVFMTIPLLAALVCSGTTASSQNPRVELPGGSTELTETFQDWIVNCRSTEGIGTCALTQEQLTSSDERLLLVSLDVENRDAVSGFFLLPFGLLVQEGVKFQIDNGPLSESTLNFYTCQPTGCIIPFSFEAEMLAALRSGKILHLLGNTDNGKYNFQVSLDGLTAAINRSDELLN